MSMISRNSTSYTPQPDGGGGAIAFFMGLGVVAIFWEFFTWIFSGLYAGVSYVFGSTWQAGQYVVQTGWSVVAYLVNGVWGGLSSAVVWSWQTISLTVTELFSAAAVIALLLWSMLEYSLSLPGWPYGVFWDTFGIYMLFGLGTGLIIGLLRFWMSRRLKVIEEVVEAVGSPDTVSAARIGTGHVFTNIATSLALAAALAFLGLVVPYVMGGLQSPIITGGPLHWALINGGGFGGFGGDGGGFGGGLIGALLLLLALCTIILIAAALVGVVVSGGLALTAGALTKLLGPAIAAISKTAGQYAGHVLGLNLALAVTKRPVPDGTSGAVMVIRSGLITGLIIGVFFAIWLAGISLLTS